MSEIKLETFVAYKPDPANGGFQFYPKPRSVSLHEGRTSIVLGDIPLPGGIPLPKDAVTAFYGYKDALTAMGEQHERAHQSGMDVVKVVAKLPVAELISGSITRENVASTRFLRLRSADRVLTQDILDEVNRLAAEQGDGSPVLFDKVLSAGARPDLLCDAIRNLPILRHINSVAYHVPDGSPSGRQIVSVFSTDFGDVTLRGEGAFDIEMPELD